MNPIFNKNDIIAFRLISGEEIVGRVFHYENDFGIKIDKPCILGIVPMHNGSGQVNINFIPYMLSAPDNSQIFFNFNDILTPIIARKEVASRYISATSSIEIPTSGITNRSSLIGA